MGTVTGNGTAVAGLGGALGYGETALIRADDAVQTVDVSAVFENGFLIGGVHYAANALAISTDGLVSFGTLGAGVLSDLGALAAPFIAIFHADVDTRLDGEGPESGAVWLDVDTVQDVVTITWADVGFYRRNASLTNTFQLQLFDRGGGSVEVVLRYQTVNWVSGDLEGGWGGLGGQAAQLGLRSAASGAVNWLAASGDEPALLDLPTTLGNSGVAGLWRFFWGTDLIRSGNDQPNLLVGGAGNDTLSGAGQNDTLRGMGGADLLQGGDGFDFADYSFAETGFCADLMLVGRNSGDAIGDTFSQIEGLFGSGFADDLSGDGGNNRLEGRRGRDTLEGRAGNDTLVGNAGDDLFIGGAGADVMRGGGGIDRVSYIRSAQALLIDMLDPLASSGDAQGDRFSRIEIVQGSALGDTLRGTNAANQLEGEAGDDLLAGRGGADSLRGGDGNDTLIGGSGGDVLDGGNGFDRLSYVTATAAVSVDLSNGGMNSGEALGDQITGCEALEGSSWDDVLTGDTGANLVFGGAGRDSLYGGAGDDTLIGGAGADVLNGGPGTDFASYADAQTAVIANIGQPSQNAGEAQGDSYVSIEGLVGSAFSDQLSGGDAADWLYGGELPDNLAGGGGGDRLDGGDGYDTADYASATLGVTVDLANPALNSGDAQGDSYIAIEGLRGSAFNDVMAGDAAANKVDGGSGDDNLSGRMGNDTLGGRTGNDTLDGGDGNDLIYGDSGNDSLLGGAGDDTLRPASGADILLGGLGADDFVHSGNVSDGTDRVEDYSAAQGDHLVLALAGVTAAQIGISTVTLPGHGLSTVAELRITYLPTNTVLWTVVDGAAITDLWLTSGTVSFDLI